MKHSWFIADTHFSHSNIIRYCKRPFLNAEEHDNTLIENWNRCVKSNDDVYFLGDFCFKGRELAERLRKQLNGQIFFIEGNHDSAARSIRHTFAWYHPVKMVEINGQAIWLSHYAHRVWEKAHYGAWHLYGHSHHKLPDDPNARSIDVGVDATAVLLSAPELYGRGVVPDKGLNPENYRPLHFDEVSTLMKKKIMMPTLTRDLSETQDDKM
jgi:calcineurin-like phosphoesterase family protein